MLVTRPDDLLSLNQWKTGYLATYVLCESLALLGLIRAIPRMHNRTERVLLCGGFVLLLFFRPRLPVAPTVT